MLSMAKTPYAYDRYYKNLSFEMPRVERPVFPDRVVSVVRYGAVGDGQTLNTEAFNHAMKDLSAQGGGTLIVPAGIWYTGPIVFASNINLHLEENALLLFTDDKDAYPLVETSFEGLNTRRAQSPISAKNAVNIAITGKGAINGGGESWRPLKKDKVTERHWKQVVASGGVLKDPKYWFPSESALRGEMMSRKGENVPTTELSDEDWHAIRDFMRPVMVSFISCKNVLLEGVLFENSPSWNIHPLMCENLIVDGITVRNPSYAQNGDGLDVESCRNVLILNSSFDVGDDAICLKSGKDADGRKRNMPTENVLVENCRVFKGHGGFVVGSEMSGGVRNVSVRNCQFLGTDVGLRFKSTRGRGGVVENIYIDGICMFDIVTDSFLFDLYYGNKKNEGAQEDEEIPTVTEETPAFRNIYVKNLVSRNAGRALLFNGLPEMNINNIHLENAIISAKFGAELSESENVHFVDVQVIPSEGPAILLNNVKNVDLSGFNSHEDLNHKVKLTGSRNKNVSIPQQLVVNNE